MPTIIPVSKMRIPAYQAGFHCACQASEVFVLLLQGLTNDQISLLMMKKYAGFEKRWMHRSEKKKFLYLLRCYIAEYCYTDFFDYIAQNRLEFVTKDLDCSDNNYLNLRRHLLYFLNYEEGLMPPFEIVFDDAITASVSVNTDIASCHEPTLKNFTP